MIPYTLHLATGEDIRRARSLSRFLRGEEGPEGQGGLPKSGISHFPHEPSSKPIIIFTHHFGGNERTLKRHVNALRELGFDSVTFEFSWHGESPRMAVPWAFKKRWARELDHVLQQLDHDPKVTGRKEIRTKIIYSFSGPGASALQLISHRYNHGLFDVVGFIGDSGPFTDPWFCTNNMIRELYRVNDPIKRKIILSGMMLMWGLQHGEKIRKHVAVISDIKPEFPILSFRPENDILVPPEQIDEVFKDQGLRNLNAVVLKGCGHLTALKQDPTQYKAVLRQFLSQF